MPPENETRAKPVDVKIHVSTGSGVDIAWADGHRSHYEFSYLRDHCPCAVCTGEFGQPPAPAPAPSNPLQLFKPRPGVRAASAVGHYAVQFDFNDGHSTGIYSFDYLRQICPCDACRASDPPSR
jgi:DUF971 family protein